MKRQPDFFVAAPGENEELASPRACWLDGRLNGPQHDDHMLVEIHPPLIGQGYGLGGADITNLILSSKYEGVSLFPVTEWPCHVYIARLLDPLVIKTMTFTKEQIEVIAWGMIFRTLGEANANAKKV
jgi:hypothetical protein